MRLLTDIVALYDIEPYSSWEYAFTNLPLLVDRLMRFALFDAVHDLPQRRITDLVPILDALFGWLRGAADETLLAFSIDDLLLGPELSARARLAVIYSFPVMTRGCRALRPMSALIDRPWASGSPQRCSSRNGCR